MYSNRREFLITISNTLAGGWILGHIGIGDEVELTQWGGQRRPQMPASLFAAMADEIDPFDVAVGQRLRSARRALNFTQEEVGRFLGRSQAAVTAYEAGKHKLQPKQIRDLCKMLGITSDRLLGIRTLKVVGTQKD